MILLLHILAGALGLVSGFVALYSAKGARVHRKSGMVFVYAMVTMGISGAGLAVWRGIGANAIGGLIAAYLVITAMTTVRPRTPGSRRLDVGATLLAFAVGLASVTLGFKALSRASGTMDGIPAPMFFLFAAVGLLGVVGDLRAMRSGGLQGAPRLARHLWRMCLALWIATASFFLGQADVFPEPLRTSGLLVLPVLSVLLAMLYWLWRVRVRRSTRPVFRLRSQETT